ncbi:hypothetical protein [Herbidospora mongoliensis]|uniref:hypothetical protein n=1 Tax=Herbidospora mongoliensis TaxID=688067 RepID=UPI000ADEA3CA|nr:hypothetical protein [Herbidospora mongoliensis]
MIRRPPPGTWRWIAAIVLTGYSHHARGPVHVARYDSNLWTCDSPIMVEAVFGWDWLVVPLAFGFWLWRRGRAPGFVAAGYVLAQAVIPLVAVLADGALGKGCVVWAREQESSLSMMIFVGVVALLIVPRTRGVLLTVALGTALLVVDAEDDLRMNVSFDDCMVAKFDLPIPVSVSPEERFLCAARQWDHPRTWGPVYPRAFAEKQIVNHGRWLCGEVDDRDGPLAAELLATIGRTWERVDRPLRLLCPDVYAARQAAFDRDCPDSLPMLVVPGQATVSHELTGAEYWLRGHQEKGDPHVEAGELADADGGIVHVLSGLDEGDRLCVTFKPATARPPLMSADWDRVVEMSISTVNGILTMSNHEGAPNLTPAGPGNYRIRVYSRDIHREEHAIVTFPGDPAGKVVHRG